MPHRINAILSRVITRFGHWLERGVVWWRRRGRVWRCLGATVVAAVALAANLTWPNRLGQVNNYLLWWLLVVALSWVSGMIAGLWATLLLTLAQYRFFMVVPLPLAGYVNLGLFMGVGSVSSLIIGSRRLEEPTDRLTPMLHQLQEGVVITDAEGIIKYANPAMERMCGANLAGRSATSLGSGEGNAGADPLQLAQALRQRRVLTNRELDWESGNGSRVVALASIMPMVEAEILTGAVITVREITDRKLREEQKDQFISIASHELRTPVTSLKLNAQRLLRQAVKQGAAANERSALESIKRQADKLGHLVRNLLDVSQLESGQLTVRTRPLLIDEYLTDIIERLRLLTPRRSLEVQGALDGEVVADPDRLEQVLTNLVANAVQHSPEDSLITISLTPEPGRVVVGVRDEGEGIERTKQVHLFDRFYQVGSGGGAGLGLYIAKQLILQHSGTIWVSSEPGAGSTFYFSLPRVQVSAAARRNVRIKS